MVNAIIYRFTRALFVTVLLITLGAIPVLGNSLIGDSPPVAWKELLGGIYEEEASSVQQTSDGGFIILGNSESPTSGNITGINHGHSDLWVVKLDASGTMQWQRLLGGIDFEYGRSIQATSDGGYIVLGESGSSNSGNVTATNHYVDRTHLSNDLWVVKLDSVGEILWQRLLGGSSSEYGGSIQQTADGGYILLGSAGSSESGDVIGTNHGGYDYWVVKLDSGGTIQWQQLFGGSGNDNGFSIEQTSDSGYILLGYSKSSASYDVSGWNHGDTDLWIVKLSGTGVIQWEKLLGGGGSDYGGYIQQTSDSGYILSGTSWSSGSGNLTYTNHGDCDIWTVKLSDVGAIQWQRLLGGNAKETGGSIQQTADGGFVLIGSTGSGAGGDLTSTSHGGWDYWVVKLDNAGANEWQKRLGGTGYDYGQSIQQTADDGYILLGESASSASGDVSGTNHGTYDIWVVKLEADAQLPPTTQPTPTQTIIILAVPPGTVPPTDVNTDGLYEDVNGNERKDFADVVLYFNQMTWIADHEPVSAFDYNGNGRIDFADVVWLFNNL